MVTIEITLPEITKVSQLEVGKYYWCYPKNGGPPTIKRCSVCPEDDLCFYLGDCFITEKYNPVFKTFEVRGPIPQGTIVI